MEYPSSHYHIYVDLDRTIINTTQWLREIAEALAQLYPAQVTAKEFLAAQPRYMLRPRTNPTAPTYVLAAQLAALGLDAASVIEQLEQTALADGHLQYPGVASMLRTLSHYGTVQILTYGDPITPHCKARLCPAVRALVAQQGGQVIITTLQDKAQWLRRAAAANPGQIIYLIDDKPVAVAFAPEPDPPIRCVQIDHTGQLTPRSINWRSGDWPICHTLAQATNIIQGDIEYAMHQSNHPRSRLGDTAPARHQDDRKMHAAAG